MPMDNKVFGVSTNVSNNPEFDVKLFVIERLGARRSDMSIVLTLTTAYIVIFICGIVGNISTCFVISRNSDLHTATNYYLFSLAVSDLLILVLGLPPELYSIWKAYPWTFGEVFCVVKAFVSELTSYASVLTITAFTVERYIAICYPIKAQLFSRPSRAKKIILVVWIVSTCGALPYPIYTRVFYYLYIPNSTVPIEDSLLCNIPIKWHNQMIILFQVSFFIFFIPPMLSISVMYVIICKTLSSKVFNGASQKQSRISALKARRAIIKMLVAVVVAFFVCWAPFHAQRLMTSWISYQNWTPALLEAQTYLFYVSGVLYFLSSTINPVLYNLMSRKYRRAFKRTICRCLYTEAEIAELAFNSVLPSERSTYLTVYSSPNRLTRVASSTSFRSERAANRYGSTSCLTDSGTVSTSLLQLQFLSNGYHSNCVSADLGCLHKNGLHVSSVKADKPRCQCKHKLHTTKSCSTLEFNTSKTNRCFLGNVYKDTCL